MLHGGAGRFSGNSARTQMIGMEPVIGDQPDGGLWPGQREQPGKKHVRTAVPAVNDILVHLKLMFWNAIHARRVIVHEGVTEVIDAVVIDGQEIPVLILQNPSSGIVNGAVLGQDLAESYEMLVLLLIDAAGFGN